MKRKSSPLFVSFLFLCLTFTGCGSMAAGVGTNVPIKVVEKPTDTEIVKPEKITVMVNGTMLDVENGRNEFEALWEEKLGIDIEFIQPDHDTYYDDVMECFETGELPDVVLLGSNYYAMYAKQQLLADITEYYSGSELQGKIQAAGKEYLIDGIRIKGHLYGITPTRGNGCMTYIKKNWLDQTGLLPPTNYEEYLHMLEVFSTQDPDGDGIMGNTYGVNAAGIFNIEAPYTNYLPELYQDAYPSFYQNEEGVWVDGFLDESMMKALERMTYVYQNGWMDPEIAQNGTSACRDKFYANEYGCFTYWAGTWAHTLSKKCKEAEIDGEIVALPAIAEVGNYIERVAPVWCITSKCKNPHGVYKYFLETMLDGGDVEYLWTYSPISDDFTKTHIDHMLAIVPLQDDPGKFNDDAVAAQNIFDHCSQMINLPYGTEAYSIYQEKLLLIKQDLVTRVVTQGLSIEEAYAEFNAGDGRYMSDAIAASFNAE